MKYRVSEDNGETGPVPHVSAWAIIDDKYRTYQVFDDEEQATKCCELMNCAYQEGWDDSVRELEYDKAL